MSYSYIAPKKGQMNLRSAREIVSRITLTGPWFEKWYFEVKNFNGTEWEGQDFYLQVRAKERCNQTGADAEWGGRKFHISNYATPSEVVLTAWKAIHTAIEHEARENFLLDGEQILDPHTDIFDLLHEKKYGFIGQDVREDASEVFQLTPRIQEGIDAALDAGVIEDGVLYEDFVVTQEAVREYEENLTSRMGSY